MKKSKGRTASERYLAKLCDRTFLSLWSFPNVFSDRGRKNGMGHGKEVCDLLVVFGDDVIIFSDKSCEFKDTGNTDVDWRRWHRRAITKSENQVQGAERWMRDYPDRLFIDPDCTTPLPIPLPPLDRRRVHRVVVALGATEACKRFYGGGSGSLRLRSYLLDPQDRPPEDPALFPFTVGHTDPNKGYVHIFDDVTLDIVMGELDTVKDFCAYLTKKENLIRSGVAVDATGEEDLLAVYLRDINEEGEHDFQLPSDLDGVVVVEGMWTGRLRNPQYLRKKEADKVSYVWDRLIEHFNAHVARGTAKILGEGDQAGYEKGIRILASLPRVERRALAKGLLEFIQISKPNQTSFRGTVWGREQDLGFSFLLFPPRTDRSYEEYRIVRHNLLDAYCCVLKMENRQLKQVIGIALDPHHIGRGGEELLYRDFTIWTDADDQAAREDQERLGVLTRVTRTECREMEYPEATMPMDTGTLLDKDIHGQPLNRHQRRRQAALSRRT